jgi:hypothetical protein
MSRFCLLRFHRFSRAADCQCCLLLKGASIFTYSDIVVTSSRRKPALAVRFKVGRVDGRIIVVPGHQQRSCLHRDQKWGELAASALCIGCVMEKLEVKSSEKVKVLSERQDQVCDGS